MSLLYCLFLVLVRATPIDDHGTKYKEKRSKRQIFSQRSQKICDMDTIEIHPEQTSQEPTSETHSTGPYCRKGGTKSKKLDIQTCALSDSILKQLSKQDKDDYDDWKRYSFKIQKIAKQQIEKQN